MEYKVYVKYEKAEKRRHASCQQLAEILAEYKEKVAEVRQLTFCKMAEKMKDM